jgi:hypothetical protein
MPLRQPGLPGFKPYHSDINLPVCQHLNPSPYTLLGPPESIDMRLLEGARLSREQRVLRTAARRALILATLVPLSLFWKTSFGVNLLPLLGAVVVVGSFWVSWPLERPAMPIAMYSVANAVFIGLAAVFLWRADPERTAATFPAFQLALTFFVLSLFVACSYALRLLQRVPVANRAVALPLWSDRRLASVTGALILVAMGSFLPGFSSGLLRHIMFALVVLVASYAFRRGESERWQLSARRWPIVFVHVGLVATLFVSVFFTGGGRIVFMALGTSLLIVWALERRRNLVIPVVLLGMLPAVVLSGLLRTGEDRTSVDWALTQDVWGQGQGLGSLYAPLETLTDIVELKASGRSPPEAMGRTFAAAALYWVPRSLWPSKPIGLGAEYTEFFMPRARARGHSMAALLAGEWMWNFGLPGLFFGGIGTGFVLGWASALYTRRLGGQSRSPAEYALWATAISGMYELVWVGTFTFAARTVTSCLVILLLWRTAPDWPGWRGNVLR